jgi:peptidoglycan/LPS O-acetylase OafA/YrhL
MLTLRRITAGGSFIPQIDGLRFVAILSVVLFHLHGSLMHNGAVASPFVNSGEALQMLDVLSKRGVEVFFVISAFILGLPFARERLYGAKPVQLSKYFLRRVTRLEPVYFVNLLFCGAAYVIVGEKHLRDMITHFIPSMLYLHEAIFHTSPIINGVAWSLEVEVQFYILVPILTSVFFIRQASLRRAILLVTIIAWSIFSLRFAGTEIQLTLVYYLPFFLAGLLVCDLFLEYGASWETALVWDITGLVGWPLVWYFGPHWGHLVLPLVMALLFVGVFRGRLSSYLFSIPWITNIGGMCYTIYLFHSVLMSTAGKLTKRFYLGGGFWGYYALQATLILPLVLGFCTIFFLLLERPCMDKTWPSKVANYLRSLRTSSSDSRKTLA